MTGDALIRLPTWLAGGSLGVWTRFLLETVSGTGMLTCFAVAVRFRLKAKPKPRKPPCGGRSRRERRRARARMDSLGWFAHGFLSLKARISRLLAGHASLRTAPLHDSVPASVRVEPRFEGATFATPAPQLDAETSDDEDEEEEVEVAPPMPRKPKAAPRTSRKWRLSVAAARIARHAEGDRTATFSPEALQTNATALEGVLAGFWRARRDHQCPARPRRYALRARARARASSRRA